MRNPDIERTKVEDAARLIDMHDFIMQLPGGYDYNVMERGATLSLGQRQLLSFIRALLFNPAILILDEATSSIDTESELLIEKAIDKLISERTSIVIAHRLSTIQRADQIIVLDKGEIKEIGTHAELLQKSGFYSRLYEMQFEKTISCQLNILTIITQGLTFNHEPHSLYIFINIYRHKIEEPHEEYFPHLLILFCYAK